MGKKRLQTINESLNPDRGILTGSAGSISFEVSYDTSKRSLSGKIRTDFDTGDWSEPDQINEDGGSDVVTMKLKMFNQDANALIKEFERRFQELSIRHKIL